MGKESYGVTLSLEYKKALIDLKKYGENNLHRQAVKKSEPESKFIPTNAFEKITRTCDFKFNVAKAGQSITDREDDDNLGGKKQKHVSKRA